MLRFENGKSDKHILDHLLNTDIYDKRLLPPSYGKYIYNNYALLFRFLFLKLVQFIPTRLNSLITELVQ